MKLLRYWNKRRYKLARGVSAVAPGVVERVELRIPMRFYSADRAHWSFPHTNVDCVSLLNYPALECITATVCAFDKPQMKAFAVAMGVGLCEVVPFFEEAPTVSGHLFVALGRKQIKGKHYGKRSPETGSHETLPFPDFQTQSRAERGLRKSFKELRKGTRKGPDLWDLLFPVLQAPVVEGFSDLLDLPPRCRPYSYQWEGIKFLVEREAALLGDDMGTGKTIQAILAARFLFQSGKVRRALILAPVSVLPNWDRELEKWAPSLRVTFVRGNRDTRQVCWDMPAHVWVTTYDTLRQDIDYLKNRGHLQFGLAILDEAQKIKNRNTGMSMAVRHLQAARRWGLTGTPIENRLEELAAIFSFLKPQLFPREFTPDEAKRILQPYFLRRRKSDVLKDLPALTEYPQWIRLTEEQQKTYDRLERERVVELYKKGKTITAQNILTLIMELKKVCNRDPDTEKSAKLDWLLENLEEMVGEDNKVLVFTQFRDVECGGSEWLEEMLSSFGAVNYCRAGNDHQIKKILHEFATRPEKRIFIGNPRTAGIGLNELKCANYVVHFDHWWNPAVTSQATARAHRPGQTKNVFVYHLWVEDTIEKMILDKTIAKQRLYDQVIDSLSSGITEDVLFDVYDDLLVKHGFKPLNLGKGSSGRSSEENERSKGTEAKTESARIFEQRVAALFEKMGYTCRLTPSSHDGGVDVIATRQSGYSLEKLAIQCKYQRAPVGRPVIQQLLGVVSSDTSYTKGYLVTNSDITREACDLVQTNGRLGVIAGIDLIQLFTKHGIAPM